MPTRTISGTLDTFSVDAGSEVTYEGPTSAGDKGLNIRGFKVNPGSTGDIIIKIDRSSGVNTMEIFQEDRMLRTGSYLVTAADTAAITAGIGWNPRDDDGSISYSIADGGGGSYDVTAMDETGVTVCIRFPAKDPCP